MHAKTISAMNWLNLTGRWWSSSRIFLESCKWKMHCWWSAKFTFVEMKKRKNLIKFTTEFFALNFKVLIILFDKIFYYIDVAHCEQNKILQISFSECFRKCYGEQIENHRIILHKRSWGVSWDFIFKNIFLLLLFQIFKFLFQVFLKKILCQNLKVQQNCSWLLLVVTHLVVVIKKLFRLKKETLALISHLKNQVISLIGK